MTQITLGKKIKILRFIHGLSQEQLGDRAREILGEDCSLPQPLLSRVENDSDKQQLGSEQLIAVGRVLGVDLHDLLLDTGARLIANPTPTAATVREYIAVLGRYLAELEGVNNA